MAKVEQQVTKPNKNKKLKAKKRKHAPSENEVDEVANKSLIVELPPQNSKSKKEIETVPEHNKLKRKQKIEATIKEKHIKTVTAAEEVEKAERHAPEIEEGANESLIVKSSSPLQTSKSEQNIDAVPEHKLKRKHKNEGTIKVKYMKRGTAAEEVSTKEETEKHASDEDELREPTLEELQESEKPENIKAIVTVRQKKKQKHLKRLEARKDQSVNKEKQRNTEYLQRWQNNRTVWKFEKLRQISIQLTMFDEQKLEADVWPIALEYLSSSKGASKERVVKLAEAVIDELDAQCKKLEDEAERQSILDSSRYQRARQLLQSLN